MTNKKYSNNTVQWFRGAPSVIGIAGVAIVGAYALSQTILKDGEQVVVPKSSALEASLNLSSDSENSARDLRDQFNVPPVPAMPQGVEVGI